MVTGLAFEARNGSLSITGGGGGNAFSDAIERLLRSLVPSQAFSEADGDGVRCVQEGALWTLMAVLHGDLGVSMRNGQPVLGSLLDALGRSLLLAGCSLLLMLLIAIPLGIVAAARAAVSSGSGTTPSPRSSPRRLVKALSNSGCA